MAHILSSLREVQKKLDKDDISSFAAQSCFYIILSFVPCVVVLMSLVRFLPIPPDTMISMCQGIAPSQIMPVLENIIYDVYQSPGLTLTSVTAVGTLLAAGKGFLVIIHALNIIYETNRTHSWYIQLLMSTIYTLIFLIILAVSLLSLVFGRQLVNVTAVFTPQLSAMIAAILNNKMIFFPCTLILVFLMMYLFIPGRKSSLSREFPGAVISAIGWCLYSYFYSLYVNYSPNFSYMYGSLTTLIFALVWIYSCMFIFFLGAEINTFISKWFFKPLTSISDPTSHKK
jgi:membrane protein